MPSVQMVDLQGQYRRIQEEINASIQEVLDSSQYINGEMVDQFSDQLSKYLDDCKVIPCANGTDALQIALMALDPDPGDEVITTPFTFVSTAEVIALLGLKPVFVDVAPEHFTMSPELLEEARSEKTLAVIPVHLFGQCAHMDPILEWAFDHDIAVIEDNAQAIGSDYIHEDGSQTKAGTMGQLGTTSFFPSKNLGCFGDGGAMFTRDEDLAAKLKRITNHGSSEKYKHTEVGVNSRLDAIQAAVLSVKLNYLEDYNRARREAADRYDQLLKDIPGIAVPSRAAWSTHVFHQYTLKIEGVRDQLHKYLLEQDIPNAIYYPIPLHLQKAYKHYGYEQGDFPVSEELAGKVLSLPMHTELDEETQEFVAGQIETFMEKHG